MEIKDMLVEVFLHQTKVWASIRVDQDRYLAVYGPRVNFGPTGGNPFEIKHCMGGLVETGGEVNARMGKLWEGYDTWGKRPLSVLGAAAVATVKLWISQHNLQNLIDPDAARQPSATPLVLSFVPLAPNPAMNGPWVF